MAETSLQMLEIARGQSAQLIGSLENSMKTMLDTQRMAGQAEVNLRLQGLQFAEEQRQNDANITQINNANTIAAKRYELDAELAPLKLETERLQLETQRQIALQNKRATDVNFMKTITAPWSKSVASQFARNENPAYMRAYLELESQWLAKVSGGEKFDGDAYQRGINQINEQFKDSKADPNAPWSAEISNMMGMVDPQTQQQYNMRNPEVVASKNMLTGSFLESENTAEFWEKYGRMFEGDEVLVGKMDVARTAFQANNYAMKGLVAQMQKLGPAIGVTSDPKEQARARKEYDALYTQYEDLQKRNANIKLSFTTGKLDNFDQPQTPPVAPPIADLNKLPKDPPSSDATLGIEGGDESTSLKIRVDKVRKLFETEEGKAKNPADPLAESELKFVSGLGWFENNLSTSMDSNTKKRIKYEIMDGIEATGSKSMYNETKIRELFSLVSEEGSSIPISPFLAKKLFSNLSEGERSKILGKELNQGFMNAIETAMAGDTYHEGTNYSISFGPTAKDKKSKENVKDASFNTYEGIENFINKEKSKEVRALLRQELFAALTTATLDSAIGN